MYTIKLLDCTLRDGGYINNWKFGKRNIKKILDLLIEAKVDIIECGYLNDISKHTDEETLFSTIEESYDLVDNRLEQGKFVYMINVGDYDVTQLPKCREFMEVGIRVCFHKKDLKKAVEQAILIKEKGYEIYFQPMATFNYTDNELLELLEYVNKIKPYAFYIVDSYGVIRQNELLRLFYFIDNNLEKSISLGYHSHNNMQLAYSNSQCFIEIISKRNRILDSSVFGMGRGAGNLNTELLIEYMNNRFDTSYKSFPILKIIDKVLNKIYEEKYWGYTLPYFLSSKYRCHPNYATHLMEKNTLTLESLDEILEQIPEEKKGDFKKDFIEKLYFSYQKHFINDNDAMKSLRERFEFKDILLIGPGSSIKKNSEWIMQQTDHKICISVNFCPENIDILYIFISNERRYERIIESRSEGNYKLIITSNIKEKKGDYVINSGSLLINNEFASDNALLMCLRLLSRLNVKSVFLAGFDGLTNNGIDYYNPDMEFIMSEVFVENHNKSISEGITKIRKELPIYFLTDSIYCIE